jgi:hypothetical protein
MFQGKKRIHHRERRGFCVDFSVLSVSSATAPALLCIRAVVCGEKIRIVFFSCDLLVYAPVVVDPVNQYCAKEPLNKSNNIISSVIPECFCRESP